MRLPRRWLPRAADEPPLALAPRVRFPRGFARRLEACGARLAVGAAAGEGAGRARPPGPGLELVGFRPYQPGEPVDRIDWTQSARLERPWVRVTRREASERWRVVVDVSASMGIGGLAGEPGKLQLAAEVAAGLAFCGAARGARVEVAATDGPRAAVVARRADVAAALAFLAGLEARGVRGLGEWARGRAAERSGGERWFLIGDLLDLAPGDVAGLARRGREVHVVGVLAPHELEPRAAVGLEWTDPEGGARAPAADAEAARVYGELLRRALAPWERGRSGPLVRHGVVSSAAAFEDVVAEVLGA